MEQGTWLAVLTGGMGAITTIVGALIAAFKIMWTRLEACQQEHTKCREETAELRTQNRYQGQQIEQIHERAVKAEENAIKAADVGLGLAEKVSQLERRH